MAEPATKVVVAFPADLSAWGRWQLEERSFESYLRKTRGAVAAGDVWEVFLDVGCCGDSLDVPLTVEAVEDGDRMGPETEIEWVEGGACGLAGGWRVQSAGGPSATTGSGR